MNGDYGKTETDLRHNGGPALKGPSPPDETRALGIGPATSSALTRTRVTASAISKTASSTISCPSAFCGGFTKGTCGTKKQLPRRTYVHVTVYEEVGHGSAGSVPAGVSGVHQRRYGLRGRRAALHGAAGVDLRKGLRRPVQLPKSSASLIDAAKREGADYAVDVYPHYGSDVEATLSAGYDIRHGLIGSGVYASHGYERSHKAGVLNT